MITSTGKLIDDALEAVEKENPKLKNVPVAAVCDRRKKRAKLQATVCGRRRRTWKSRVAGHPTYDPRANRRRPKPRKTSDGRRPTPQLHIDSTNLAGFIDLIATIPCQHADLHASKYPLFRSGMRNIGKTPKTWLDGWVRDYPPDVFPSLWERLDVEVELGTLRCSEEVDGELENKDDGVSGHGVEPRLPAR